MWYSSYSQFYLYSCGSWIMSLQGHTGMLDTCLYSQIINFSFCSPLFNLLGLTSYHRMQKTNICKNRVTQGRGVTIFHLRYFFFSLCPLSSDRSVKSFLVKPFLGSQLVLTSQSKKTSYLRPKS